MTQKIDKWDAVEAMVLSEKASMVVAFSRDDVAHDYSFYQYEGEFFSVEIGEFYPTFSAACAAAAADFDACYQEEAGWTK